jgi:hypothetical protein
MGALEPHFLQGGVVEDPGITRLDIDLYRRTLQLTLSDVARKETLALLADAESRLRIEPPNPPPPNQPKRDQDQ